MNLHRPWQLLTTSLFCSLVFGESAPTVSPVPTDSLELVVGTVQPAETAETRQAALQLLARARNSFALRGAGRVDGQGFDLKVSFSVNSLGQTDYDGDWTMEDQFDPRLGFRWTASSGTSYTVAEVSSRGMTYRDGTTNIIPLRLQEVRSELFDAIPSDAYLKRQLIRTSTATFRGASLTCVLFSPATTATQTSSGRRWEEAEECINPQSGLLQVHSPIPGRYIAYDYADAPQFGGRTLPKKLTISEAGQVVSQVTVDSLTGFSAADAELFTPTPEMRRRGPAPAMASSQRISRTLAQGPLPAGTTLRPVCVFGVVNSSGQLVEAHSLQPSDPNSQAAVEDAKLINFSGPAAPGARPQQHFVFVIEKFVSAP